MLVLEEEEFEAYVEGDAFRPLPTGSTNRTTHAVLPITRVRNRNREELFVVVQPCVLAGDTALDFCAEYRLPREIGEGDDGDGGKRLFDLKSKVQMERDGDQVPPHAFVIDYYRVNPMPDTCQESGWVGVAYLLVLLPYFIATLFGLRLCQMAMHCETFRANLERTYKREFDVPEEEVDYWQPMPWDRKVPKTRLLGPCCWKKMRHPFEPFYTWWRHENYFTWICFPYRNERLSRGERALIIFCSLYITFYVSFLLVMLHDSMDHKLSLWNSVILYSTLLMLLPTLGKAVFKEIFKLIFRQRRKFFRLKAAGGDTSEFSFRLAFWAQVAVVVFITIAQGPLLYIWLYRSCLFLREFVYFGMLAAVFRFSLLGLAQDYLWYVVIKTWGWKDLCPYCTERLVHCDCFNDELFVLSVEQVGPKWELILMLDRVLSRTNGHEAQFQHYSAEQLRERWAVLVDRAEKHMAKMEKLRAYELRKARERENGGRLSFLRVSLTLPPQVARHDDNRKARRRSTSDEDGRSSTSRSTDTEDSTTSPPEICSCALERKVLAINSRIELDKFEKHYDSTIADIFTTLQQAIHRNRGHSVVGELQDDSHVELPGTFREHLTRSTRHYRHHHHHRQQRHNADRDDLALLGTPELRMERREAEKRQRERVFHVLSGYDIEEQPYHQLDPSAKQDQPAPALHSPSRQSPLLPRKPGDGTWQSADSLSVSQDDLVVIDISPNGDNESAYANEAVNQPPYSGSKTYSVVPRQPTLLRRLSQNISETTARAIGIARSANGGGGSSDSDHVNTDPRRR